MSIVLNGQKWITWEEVQEMLRKDEETRKNNQRVAKMFRSLPHPKRKKHLRKNPKK